MKCGFACGRPGEVEFQADGEVVLAICWAHYRAVKHVAKRDDVELTVSANGAADAIEERLQVELEDLEYEGGVP